MKILKVFFIFAALVVFPGCQSNQLSPSNTGERNSGKSAGQTTDAGGTTGNSNEENSNSPESNLSNETDGTNLPATNKKIESIYTDLTAEKCKTLESNPNEGGSYRGECAGVGSYKIEVLEGDLRQSINLVAPNDKKFELDFWTKVSGGFSSLGDKAEWRVERNGKDIKPMALIVRYNVSENPEIPEKNTSYLVVTKITKDSACITDVVKPAANANEKARQLADSSANKACKAS